MYPHAMRAAPSGPGALGRVAPVAHSSGLRPETRTVFVIKTKSHSHRQPRREWLSFLAARSAALIGRGCSIGRNDQAPPHDTNPDAGPGNKPGRLKPPAAQSNPRQARLRLGIQRHCQKPLLLPPVRVHRHNSRIITPSHINSQLVGVVSGLPVLAHRQSASCYCPTKNLPLQASTGVSADSMRCFAIIASITLMTVS